MDRINIIEPNGVERTRPMPIQGLSIGRGTDNDISLGYDDVSRYHAKVTFDGRAYYVTDLNSANGTLLGNRALTPNTPTPWRANETLRVGRVEFRLLSVRSTGAMTSQERDISETIVGQVPGKLGEEKGSNRLIWLVAGLVAALLVCSGVGTALLLLS